MSLYALIMAGGLGTRLWPLTSGNLPKAFLSFDKTGISLLQCTISRLSLLTAPDNIFIVAGQSHTEGLRAHTHGVPDKNIILEPAARSTLPCVGLAGTYIKQRDPEGVMIVLPGEQFIRDEKEFRRLALQAAEASRNYDSVVSLGIKPLFPATNFGYIQLGDEILNNIFISKGFIEKPDKQKAGEFLASGKYLWNSGIYIFPVSLLFELIFRFAPDIYNGLSAIKNAIGTTAEKEIIKQVYSDMRSISIDYAIMEKSEKILVIPADMGWNDMGTWTEVSEVWEKDDKANSCFGQHIGIDSTGCIIYSPDKLVATIGIQNVIIINTPEGLLLCARDRADDVKVLVQKMLYK